MMVSARGRTAAMGSITQTAPWVWGKMADGSHISPNAFAYTKPKILASDVMLLRRFDVSIAVQGSREDSSYL